MRSKNIFGNSVVDGKMVIVHHHPNQALYQFPGFWNFFDAADIVGDIGEQGGRS